MDSHDDLPAKPGKHLNDKETIRVLVENNRGLVYTMARQFGLPMHGAANEELITEGYSALFRAARTYNETIGIPFASYACLCIERHMRYTLRVQSRHGFTKTDERSKHTKRDQPIPAPVDIDAIPIGLGLPVTNARHTWYDEIELVRWAVASLPANERNVITLTMLQGLSLKETAVALAYTKEWVRSLRFRALARLYTILKDPNEEQ